MKTLTIDIETIPDLAAHQRAGMELGSVFPPFPLHEIACVSILTAQRYDWDSWRFGIETLSREVSSERAIIAELEQILESADEVITFNGRGFDVPVLLARAAVTQQRVPNIAKLYRRNQPGFHADLLDEITGFGTAPRLKLAQLCAAFAIPAKLDVDGSEVKTLAEQGEWKRIADYCETDVVATWLAAQRWRRTQIEEVGRPRREALSVWLESEQPRLAHLLPYTAVQGDPPGGRQLGDAAINF